MESTYDPDTWPGHPNINNDRLVEFGKDPRGFPHTFQGIHKQPAAEYEESGSGGPGDAWQTFYPATPDGLGSAYERHNPWISTPEGWHQAYVPSDLTKGHGSSQKKAKWFDSGVLQYDGYGRRSMPDAASPRRYQAIDGWEERAVNTTIGCAMPGCSATTMLQAYDGEREEAANCRLSIMVHPTDFDDDWSKESFEWWKVNGKVVNTRCDPRARGCNATASEPLYSCMSDFELTDLVALSRGTMQIEGKISAAVDECPYQGMLLNGVVAVACMVRTIPPTLAPVGFNVYESTGSNEVYNESEVIADLFNCSADPTCHGNGHDGYIGGYNGTDGYPQSADSSGTTFPTGPGSPYGAGGAYDLNGPNGPYGPDGAGSGSPASPYDPNAPYDAQTNPHGPGGYGPYGPGPPGNPNYPYGPNGPTGPPYGPYGPNGPAYGPGPYGDGPYGNMNPELYTGPGIGGPDYGAGACIPPCPVDGPGAGAFPGTRAAAGASVVAGTGNVPIQCDVSGCTAQTIMNLDNNVTLVAQNGGKCTLSVAINQTDFDEDLGSVEMVSKIQVESYTLASEVKPGKNPCTAKWSGSPLLQYETFVVILTDYDVTNLAASLVTLNLQAVITQRVDECASQGFLFDGLARVDCTVAENPEASLGGSSTFARRLGLPKAAPAAPEPAVAHGAKPEVVPPRMEFPAWAARAGTPTSASAVHIELEQNVTQEAAAALEPQPAVPSAIPSRLEFPPKAKKLSAASPADSKQEAAAAPALRMASLASTTQFAKVPYAAAAAHGLPAFLTHAALRGR